MAGEEFSDLARALGDPRALPDLAWVAALTGATPTQVAGAIEGLRRHRDVLEAVHRAHRQAGRDFYAQIQAPLELYALVRLARPRNLIEAGVSSGVSSTHLLLGVSDNHAGTLHSIDLPTLQRGPTLAAGETPVAIPPGMDSGWAVPPHLQRRWDLNIGPSERVLPKLVEELPSVDLFLHDDKHTPRHLAFELATVRPKLSAGAIVLADNTQWTGRVFDRFAEGLGVPVHRRSGSDLVGLRVRAGTAGRPPEAAPRAHG